MILLTATTHTLELNTTTTASIDWTVHYVDLDANTLVTSGSGQGNVASATDTTIVAAPSAGQERKVQQITLCNRSTTASNTVEIAKDVSGTEYRMVQLTLQPGETLHYSDGRWTVRDISGREKRISGFEAGYTGTNVSFFKVGAGATEAAGIRYLQGRDTGSPGVWAPGTPGLAGRTCDGTAASDAGCLPWTNAATGNNYLTNWTMLASATGTGILVDVLWVNSGAVVTTTTAQTVNSVAFPARDVTGTVNGVGTRVGILVSTATTNGAAVTNTTMSYTNQASVAGRTATMSSFPATCTAGSLIPFQLAAGDTGVQSIQSVTLGTSYGAGAIHLIVYRELAMCPMGAAWLAGQAIIPSPGVRLYSGSCLLPMFIPTSAATYTTAGSATWIER